VLRAGPPTCAGQMGNTAQPDRAPDRHVAEVAPAGRRALKAAARRRRASGQRRGRGNARRSPAGPSSARQRRRRPLGSAPPPEHQEWPELVPCLPCLDSSAAAAREFDRICRAALLVARVLSGSKRPEYLMTNARRASDDVKSADSLPSSTSYRDHTSVDWPLGPVYLLPHIICIA
jgi:hypothetical protein